MVSLLHILPLAALAHASFSKLPSGNGFGTAVVDLVAGKLAGLREHTFQSVDAGVMTRDLVYDAYFGLRGAAGRQGWLAGVPVERADLDGGVITFTQRFAGLTATTTAFAPFGVAAPSVVLVLEVKNDGAAPIDDVRVYSLANAHLGDGDGTKGQRVDWSPASNGYLHRSTRSQRVMLVRALTPPSHHATNPSNPFPIVQRGDPLPDVATSGDVDDVASGFQFDLGRLAPGASASVGVVLAYHPFGDAARLDAMTRALLGALSPRDLVAAERSQWAAWLDKARTPARLDEVERRLYRQQLAILRMGQVREPDDVAADYRPHGQLVAALRPGMWDIAWVRDGCLAIAALARAGLLDEARAGLEFMLRAQAGLYQSHVGRPYRISVVRYFGKGKEESDVDQNGPNIEFDGFGLFLWATSQYLEQGGAPAFLDQWFSTLTEGIADVLVGLVEPGGLLAADSSIWESHWDNGGRQHYTYSNVWAVVGLERAAGWAEGRDGARAKRYRETAARIRGAVAGRLVTGDRILRPSTENAATVDAAAVEAFNLDVLDPRGEVAAATLDAFKRQLFLPVTGRGYKRNQNGGSYDEREWVVIDLRIANALRRLGRSDEAEGLWSWVRDQSVANHGLIAELYDQKSADYAGEVPMVGFGAGAFVLAAWEREAPLPPFDGGADDGGDPKKPRPGCGCHLGGATRSGSGQRDALAAIGIAVILLLRTRRRR